MEKTILQQQGDSIPNQAELNQVISELTNASRTSAGISLSQRIQLTEQCLVCLSEAAREWVELSCQAKRIPAGSTTRGEEVLAGPVSVARYLQVLLISLKSIARSGKPDLPSVPQLSSEDRWRVPVFPTSGIYDSLVFAGLIAEACLKPGEDTSSLFDLSALNSDSSQPMPLTLVLGAGNVSAIPATDVLTKILQDGERVLLKMNPVNEYLKPVFEQAFNPLLEADLLRIVEGSSATGEYLVSHPGIERIHITGSTQTHDAIVWGGDPEERAIRKSKHEPLRDLPITSELGNVSPWIVVPGAYTDKQLKFQAENIAASIVNNASFNCLATKVIVTSKAWPQRDRFLTLIEQQLDQIPRRYAYYPGAAERWERFTGEVPDDREYLPWKLIRDADPGQQPELFQEESFVCVCAETGLEAESDTDFLEQAVEFVNQNVWGTLCAAVTVTNVFHKNNYYALEQALSGLNYGAVGVNHWPALNYAFMSTPWGGAPGADLTNVQSGIGNVHNTYFLSEVQKTILYGPLTLFPKPVWFPSHPNPEAVGWGLMKLYCRPSLINLARVGLSVVFK